MAGQTRVRFGNEPQRKPCRYISGWMLGAAGLLYDPWEEALG